MAAISSLKYQQFLFCVVDIKGHVCVRSNRGATKRERERGENNRDALHVHNVLMKCIKPYKCSNWNGAVTMLWLMAIGGIQAIFFAHLNKMFVFKWNDVGHKSRVHRK